MVNASLLLRLMFNYPGGVMFEVEEGFRGYPKKLKKKFCKFGIDYLMDYEVLELLLSFARPRKDIRALAEELLKKYKHIQAVLDAPLKELVAFSGMDIDTAIVLKLARDSSSYYLRQKTKGENIVRCGSDLIKHCRLSMSSLNHEQFRVVFLNRQNEVIDIEVLHEGTVDEAKIYPRNIVERALHHNATALIFIHNHTSGNTKPSQFDIELTGRLISLFAGMDIEVYDHIIIGDTDHLSFRDKGLIRAFVNEFSV